MTSRITLAATTVAFILAATACGGGGGGPAVTSGQSAVQQPNASVSKATALLGQSTSLGAAASSYLVTQAIALVHDGADYLAAPLSPQQHTSGFTCAGGGSVAATWQDADASNTPTAGDRIQYTFAGCGSSAFWLDNGSMTLTVVRVDAGEIADFDIAIDGVDFTSWSAFDAVHPRVSGVLQFRDAGDSVAVSAPDGLTLSLGTRGVTATVSGLAARVAASAAGSGSNSLPVTGVGGTFAIAFAAGPLANSIAEVTVTGIVPNSRSAPMDLLTGAQLTVSGAGGTQVRLSGAGSAVVVELDANGDGAFEAKSQFGLTELIGAM